MLMKPQQRDALSQRESAGENDDLHDKMFSSLEDLLVKVVRLRSG